MSSPSTLEVFSGGIFHPGGIDGSDVVGDIEVMGQGDVGGDDSFSGASDSSSGYTAYGDAHVMVDSAVGGNDYFSGGSDVYSGFVPDPSAASDVTSLVSFFFSDGVQFAGDAGEMYDRSVGGNDTMEGGINSSNLFVGDALYGAFDRAVGGNDRLVGGGAEDGYASNMIVGDAGQFGSSGGPEPRAAAGSSRESGNVTGGSDYIQGGDADADLVSTDNANFLVGDGYAIYGRSTGGADEIHGGSAVAHGDPILDGVDASVLNFIVGDGFQMQGTSTGGADDLFGGSAEFIGGDAYAVNFMAGDTMVMFGQARAGDDTLTGGDAHGPVAYVDGTETINLMAGDTFYSEGGVKFGDDKLVGGVGSGDSYVINAMYGDSGDTNPFTTTFDDSAISLFSDVSVASGHGGGRGPTYGDDTLVGGEVQAQNFLVGDAQEISGKGTKGGDDVLTGGGLNTTNTMIGDAVTMGAGTKGGNDILVSGQGNDSMWGDGQSFSIGGGGRGGSDIFAFGPENGVDVINDFRTRDRDKIDLRDFSDDPDFRDFRSFVASERMEQTDAGVVLHLNQGGNQVQVDNFVEVNTVLIVGVTLAQLTSSSFIF